MLAGRERLRGKLSYSNIGFALAPDSFTLAELRDVYEAALEHDVSATNLKRVLLRRGAIEPVGKTKSSRACRRPSGRGVSLLLAAARGDGSVRSASPSSLSDAGLSRRERIQADHR